ncbi:polysaccharide lyase 8 family protein [Nonomuraea glycinis]|uniref:polysaccharide lyase 8 family protein n=1 Tax=Nonomuraea glycinis TaxID=2047744 RepID=UPI002E164CAB|nr:polysaccharide lyase 8 family protein [Nonomuraea glycinis]
MPRYSRRSVLLLGGMATAGVVFPVREEPPAPDLTGLLDPMRARWREVTVEESPAGVRAAARHRDTMAPAAGSLWPDLPFPSFTETPARLLTMARAYAMTGDARLAAAVATGVDHYRRQVYTAGAAAGGNWWHWEIGVPTRLLDAAVLIGPHLTDRRRAALADAVDHFVPERRLADYSGTSTGANRVDLCTVMLLRALIGSDPGKAALAAAALTPVFRYVSEGDGLYRDGSFIQHTTVPYQGGYGAVLLHGLATLFAVLRDSPWRITDPDRRHVYDSVERSFAPFVHDGRCMDLVSGRGVRRQPDGDRVRGRRLAAAILLLAETASAAERARWLPMVKGWAVRGAYEPTGRVAAVLGDGEIPVGREAVGHRLLPMSARAVHRRPGWCAALSMASYRIAHYEHGNGENPRGWHTGAGMLYWWGEGHGDHYSDGFWRAADPYRLPGTTVSTRRLPDGAGPAWGGACPPARWVGGATDGTYATVGQHLYGLESTMEAVKSWVFLDDAVVCLGAGITSTDGVPVETVVDVRRTDAPLTTGAGWAHLEGHGGYVIPGDQRLRTLRGRDQVTLWLDHGTDPVAAGYAYLLLPNADLARTRARAADPGWARVLVNTGRQQGVHIPSLGITAINFWQAGSTGGVTASAPCAVLVRERRDGTATVTVSDPRRELTELTVTWRRPVTEVLRADPLLTGVATGPALTLAFGRLADRGGGSRTVRVRTSHGARLRTRAARG